jgi:hypothetical protein
MPLSMDAEQLLARLDRIQLLATELAKARGDFIEQQELSERLQPEIAGAKAQLAILAPNDPV